jgi:hypothetical protein
MRGRVEVPGRDVGIPILFVPRILSRESETRTLNSTSTDYQKKLQLFRYMVPQNLSCHDGDSTMIDFVRLFYFCHHVCESLNDTINHVCELRSWNFRVLNIWRLNPPPFCVKICCFILVDEYLYHCWRVVPASFESDPTSLDPGSIGVVGS